MSYSDTLNKQYVKNFVAFGEYVRENGDFEIKELVEKFLGMKVPTRGGGKAPNLSSDVDGKAKSPKKEYYTKDEFEERMEEKGEICSHVFTRGLTAGKACGAECKLGSSKETYKGVEYSFCKAHVKDDKDKYFSPKFHEFFGLEQDKSTGKKNTKSKIGNASPGLSAALKEHLNGGGETPSSKKTTNPFKSKSLNDVRYAIFKPDENNEDSVERKLVMRTEDNKTYVIMGQLSSEPEDVDTAFKKLDKLKEVDEDDIEELQEKFKKRYTFKYEYYMKKAEKASDDEEEVKEEHPKSPKASKKKPVKKDSSDDEDDEVPVKKEKKVEKKAVFDSDDSEVEGAE